ncbi:MAG TPA: translation elongation factor Ts [Phycisphaerae bacterium]|nr:translation elongation factor Ts [Phycisphaerae bacterium]
MAEITAKLVNELRQRTNAPMMDAKRALVDANAELGADAPSDNVVNRAAELLRERGAASADKKLANEMKEGLVSGRISNDGKLGVLLRLGCQTDFVARNDGFLKLLGDLTDLAFENNVNAPADLNPLAYPDGSGRTVEQVIKELIGGTIKENIGVTGLARFSTPNGRVEKYVHHNAKVGALVQIDGSTDDAVKVTAAEIAMHVTAAVPQVALAVDRTGLDPSIVAREKEAASEGTAGKPANIVEKIVAGKLEKYFQDVALVDQPFIKDDKRRIRDLLADTGKAVGSEVKIIRFARFKVGEA